MQLTRLSYAHLWSILLLCSLHIPKEILLTYLGLYKIGQHAGFVVVHTLIHGLHLKVIAALSLNLPTLESRCQKLSVYHHCTSIKFNYCCKFISISSTRSHICQPHQPSILIAICQYYFYGILYQYSMTQTPNPFGIPYTNI